MKEGFMHKIKLVLVVEMGIENCFGLFGSGAFCLGLLRCRPHEIVMRFNLLYF